LLGSKNKKTNKMENLQLIMATVLITLISGALVGSLIYLGVVVRKLRRTVNNNVLDIKNLESALNGEIQNVQGAISNVQNDLQINYSELDRKIDSRCDKLYDGYNKENQQIYQEIQKRDESIEHVRDLTRQALGLKK
jgi:sensor domain CHASE-containing protein